MSSRKLIATFAACSGWLASAPPAGAHRLDEYLQATRLSVSTNRVNLAIDLTPGAAIADKVLAWIDTNGDGRISGSEGRAYAEEMLRSITLEVDGRPAAIELVASSFPEWSDVRFGLGMIRLQAVAKFPEVRPGQHVISFLNRHRPESSVYLINALVPDDPSIQLGQPQRDFAQRGMTLDYIVEGKVSDVPRTWVLVALLIIVGILRLALTRRARSTGRLKMNARTLH